MCCFSIFALAYGELGVNSFTINLILGASALIVIGIPAFLVTSNTSGAANYQDQAYLKAIADSRNARLKAMEGK